MALHKHRSPNKSSSAQAFTSGQPGGPSDQTKPRTVLQVIREWNVFAIFLQSLWLFVCIIYFTPLLLLLPLALIPKVGITWYRVATGVYDHYTRIGVMCIPFSWCNFKLYITNAEQLYEFKEGGDTLNLATHTSRVDWIGAVYLALCGRVPTMSPLLKKRSTPRVNFAAEVTTAIMPIVGWSRYFFGDILLTRSFDKDYHKIMNNIKEFKRSGITRLIFISPEGTIADPGLAETDAYIKNCKDFMISLGHEPMQYLLTPRYKGMTSFITHCPGHVCSGTLTYVEGYSQPDEATGRVQGGNLCTRSLEDPLRKIPDLLSIFRGGLSLYVNFKKNVEVSDDPSAVDSAGVSLIKTQLVQDQMRKDRDLAYFEQHRKYECVKSGRDWTILTSGGCQSRVMGHLHLNAALFWMVAGSVAALSWLLHAPVATMLWWYAYCIMAIFVSLLVSYNLGLLLGDGRSRESLPGETAFKAALALLTGRSMNQGGKKTV